MPDKKPPANSPLQDGGLVFGVLNEIGIISQLSRALFEQVLPDGITVPHFSVLNHLVRVGDGVSPLKIATAFQVPKASLTNTLKGLEQRGFIVMQPNPRDGRGKLVYLSESGRSFRDEAIQLLAPHIENLSRQFEFHKLKPVIPVLQELRECMDRYRDESD
jgi:DNA-binding MarR family transcriptional regulator